MFELRNIDLHYGKSQILYNINLRAEIGNVTAIVGSNGVGKTSVLRVLSGTHKASSGSYEANGIKKVLSGEKLSTSSAESIRYISNYNVNYSLNCLLALVRSTSTFRHIKEQEKG